MQSMKGEIFGLSNNQEGINYENKIELVENDGEYALVRVRAKDLPFLTIGVIPKMERKDEDVKKAYEGYHKEGNVVYAYTTDCHLLLDSDLKRKDEVIEFAKEYTMFHKLGSVAVFKTSDCSLTDLFGERLGNYCIIFGKILAWLEIKWHVQEAYRLGKVNQGFVIIRKFGSITIRITAKNNEIPPPEPIYYFPNGDNKGVRKFMEDWAWNRNLGLKEVNKEELTDDNIKEIGKEARREVRKWLKK